MSAADRKLRTQLLRQIVEKQDLGDGVHPGLSGPRPESSASR
jgi:hypothetical protein